MTAVAARPAPAAPSLRVQLGWAVTDTLTITRRNLLVWMRVPAYLMFTVIQPVMFVLLFRYVFGGAIHVPGNYVNFLMPGIIGQTAAFASFGTAISLAQELKKGVIDRLRSMPMARSAVLAGRLVADAGRMLLTILIIVAVGYAVGFRFTHGVLDAIAMVVLATVFGVAICCIAAYTGLAIGDEESVQAFGLICRDGCRPSPTTSRSPSSSTPCARWLWAARLSRTCGRAWPAWSRSSRCSCRSRSALTVGPAEAGRVGMSVVHPD
jgi:ABC-type transport system involved in cytochrome c biogenesis permease component